jgi:hypothetical protein
VSVMKTDKLTVRIKRTTWDMYTNNLPFSQKEILQFNYVRLIFSPGFDLNYLTCQQL